MSRKRAASANEASTLVAAPPLATEIPPTARPFRVPPFTWEGAQIGKCLVNVQQLVRERGGAPVFGWAIDHGPCRRNGWYPPPLYERWLNHVIWRDEERNLWEVSPHADLDHPGQQLFAATSFLPDAAATFEVDAKGAWRARPSRYFAIRPEGQPVVNCLRQAQSAMDDEARTAGIKLAIEALREAGFQPTEWKVETIGDQTGTIWLIAD